MSHRWTIRLGAASVIALVTAFLLWRGWSSADEQLRTARAALAAGDDATVARIARSLVDLHPDHARVLQADVLLSRGDAATALTLLNRVSDKGDLRREAVALAGQCQLRMRNLPEAARAFEFVLAERPEQIDGHRGMAAVYYDQGALMKCLHHLGEVARLDPSDPRPHRMMAMIHADLNVAADAVECYRESLRRGLKEPAAAEARVELAEQLVKLGRHAEALDALTQAGETGRAEALRAEAEWALGRAAAAASRLDAALAAHADDAALLRMRGRLHIEAGDWAAAATVLERAAAADPADLVTLHQLTIALDNLGRKEDAERFRKQHGRAKDDLLALTKLNREADDRPWDPEVRLKLAEVCDRLGKQELAAMWRQSAAACRP